MTTPRKYLAVSIEIYVKEEAKNFAALNAPFLYMVLFL